MKERFCPNCGSTKVEPDRRHTNVLGDMIFNQNKWYCRECDYTGIMPSGNPEEVENIEEAEFQEAEQEKIDTAAGRAYAKYIAYILLPATLIYVIIKLVM